jgi:hypothetical protein
MAMIKHEEYGVAAIDDAEKWELSSAPYFWLLAVFILFTKPKY